jgi:hypothetical protein
MVFGGLTARAEDLAGAIHRRGIEATGEAFELGWGHGSERTRPEELVQVKQNRLPVRDFIVGPLLGSW